MVLGAVIGWFVFIMILAGCRAAPWAPVTRKRLERFAYRQWLEITPTNGPVVIAYLVTTRRWRAGGLAVATLFGVIATAPQAGARTPNATLMFAGWFVGALIAEWRVGRRPDAGRTRVALLVPRRISQYLPKLAAPFVVLTYAGVSGLLVAAAVSAPSTAATLHLLGWLLGAVVVGSVLAVVCRQVLSRPQSPAGADVLAADDAVRSRSLHVLAGVALAVAGYLLLGLHGVAAAGPGLATAPWWNHGGLEPAFALLGIFLPVLGWLSATSAYAPRRRRGVAVGADR